MKTTMKVNKMLSNKTYFQQNLIHFSCSRCAMKQIAGVNFINTGKHFVGRRQNRTTKEMQGEQLQCQSEH